jgi:hypothetical protein
VILLNGLTLDATPLINPAVVTRDDPHGGMILVNCDTGAALALNTTGRMVWNLINGRRNPAALIAAVREQFPDAPDSVPDDITTLLSALAHDGFIGYEVLSSSATGMKKSI